MRCGIVLTVYCDLLNVTLSAAVRFTVQWLMKHVLNVRMAMVEWVMGLWRGGGGGGGFGRTANTASSWAMRGQPSVAEDEDGGHPPRHPLFIGAVNGGT